jgi:glycosyltransferase involved in cell wall biosynthesis
MKIGIDISQTAYENTGVANYIENLVEHLIRIDKKNEYVLFFSSLRKKVPSFAKRLASNSNVQLKVRYMPPTMLDVLWNRLHIRPIEDFIGNVDLFISSDWTQPPVRMAKSATILFDLIVYRYPEETDIKIVETQRRRLNWVKKDCEIIFCISESTKKDAKEILGIDEDKLKVIYPGVS